MYEKVLSISYNVMITCHRTKWQSARWMVEWTPRAGRWVDPRRYSEITALWACASIPVIITSYYTYIYIYISFLPIIKVYEDWLHEWTYVQMHGCLLVTNETKNSTWKGLWLRNYQLCVRSRLLVAVEVLPWTWRGRYRLATLQRDRYTSCCDAPHL